MSDVWQKTFAEAFSETYRCPRDAYETKIFWHCFGFPYRFAARILNTCRPGFFREDREAIRRLGVVRSEREFKDELDDLHYVVLRQGGFLRCKFGMRVSAYRLDCLKSKFFG